MSDTFLDDFYDIYYIVKELDEYNYKALKLLQLGKEKEFFILVNSIRETQLNQNANYETAVLVRHLLHRNYIIHYYKDYNITHCIDDINYSEKHNIDDSEFSFIQSDIDDDIKTRMNSLISFIKGKPSKDSTEYKTYITSLSKLHSFKYKSVLNPKENTIEFRAMVKKLVSQKRSCSPIYYLPTKNMKKESLEDLKSSKNLYEAIDIVFALIKDIPGISEGKDADYWVDNTKKSDNIYYTPKNNDKNATNCITNAIEEMGIERRQYTKYMSPKDINKPSQPSKKLVLGIALYLEPPLLNKIEEFMNFHSYSLKSLFGTLTEDDVIRDDDICLLISIGFDIDVISYFMKNFGITGQRMRINNGSTLA